MARSDSSHLIKVRSWAYSAAQGLSYAELIDLFEISISKLWNRSCIIISEVTLGAIFDRTLYVSSLQDPFLNSLKIGRNGLEWDNFRQNNFEKDPQKLIYAFAFLIAEFINIAANITGDILSEPLHQELLTVDLKNNLNKKDSQ